MVASQKTAILPEWNYSNCYQPLYVMSTALNLQVQAKIAMNNTIRGLSSLPVILSHKKPGHTLHPDL